ncbi:uncharacterized protein OCT59_012734 [Rhizophagus irregularis]|uniref:uncharacterized protein n=1 Tax=Rhizophagus irregularis TaxID=588596 RepID=UPI0033278952|nr:hypothetical protein OCT59_012734 [Rhizophagus irregularis]
MKCSMFLPCCRRKFIRSVTEVKDEGFTRVLPRMPYNSIPLYRTMRKKGIAVYDSENMGGMVEMVLGPTYCLVIG